jgi:hypothetical protein
MKGLFRAVSVSLCSVTAGKILVSKEVNICYREHIPQQAGYQGISTFLVA